MTALSTGPAAKSGGATLPLEPPPSNHGGYKLPSTLKYAGLVERAAPQGAAAFDWYAATIYDGVDAVLASLAERLGGEVVEGSPMNGYQFGHAIKTPGGIVARVLHGGNGGKPHAFGGGAAGAEVCDVVRSEWGDAHHVTRLDSRLDFVSGENSDDTWDRLYEACVTLAAERGLKTSLAGDYLAKQDGRTLYIGSRKSQVFVRLYEKGKQLRRDLRESQRDAVPTDWVRLEAQIRPAGDARFAAAKLDALEAWGMSKWTRALAEDVAQVSVDAVSMQVHRESDDVRALMWMGQQYGAVLDRMVRQNGREWLDGVLDDWLAAVALQRRAADRG